MVCVEREAQQHDIENVGLLLLRRGAARSRVADPRPRMAPPHHLPAGRANRHAGFPSAGRRSPARSTGFVIGEGFVASHYIERLAARVPVVVIAGHPGRAGGRRGGGRQLVRLGRHRHPPHRRSRQATPVPRRRAAGLPRRRRAAARPWSTCCARNPHCELDRLARRGSSASAAASRRARNCSPCTAGRCRKRSCAPTTRWRSGSSRRCRRGRRSGPRGGGRGRLRRHLSPAACSIPRSPPCTSRCACWANAPAPALLDRIANPGLSPDRGAAADRAGAAVELRLPARHGDSPARRDAEARPGTFGRRQDG